MKMAFFEENKAARKGPQFQEMDENIEFIPNLRENATKKDSFIDTRLYQ